jgi:hypothetical protein
MGAPGFSAETSLYRSLQHYTTVFALDADLRQVALPALPQNGGGPHCTPHCGKCMSDSSVPTGCSRDCLDSTCNPYSDPCTGCAGACSGCAHNQGCCKGVCTNLSSDSQNCGSCGLRCPSGQVCSNGGCCPVCPAGQSCCNGTCVDLNNNSNNCGFCGNVCTGGMTCQGGTCACPAGRPTDCGGTCVNLGDSSSNCGSCGRACPSGWTCQGGQCVTFQDLGCSTTSDPNTGRTLKTCCTKMTGECTGLDGRRCIGGSSASQCCQGSPFWGERPWLQFCENTDSAGGVPFSTFRGGCDVCY